METTNASPPVIDPARIAPVLADLGLAPEALEGGERSAASGESQALLLSVAADSNASRAVRTDLLREADERLSETGALLLLIEGRRPQSELVEWRNALWPLFHAGAIYELDDSGCRRRTLAGSASLTADSGANGSAPATLMFLRRREHVMSPDATVEKFDQNAAGWNGEPASPGYPHFRWMRRFVGCFESLPANARVLDFGCGAGWCGIEAAKQFDARELCFFDPSPEMVKIAEENARANGISQATGRTGFGEIPPFPAEGEAPFDAVISSGVISFAPDATLWLEGLVGTVAPGGTLVIGDIQGTSRGMQRRRRQKALLPARELNAQSASEVRAGLEARGFHYQSGAGYQLTRPFPEAMHVNETKLKGLLTYPLLWSNQLAATTNRRLGFPGPDAFDSWVMSFVREA